MRFFCGGWAYLARFSYPPWGRMRWRAKPKKGRATHHPHPLLRRQGHEDSVYPTELILDSCRSTGVDGGEAGVCQAQSMWDMVVAIDLLN